MNEIRIGAAFSVTVAWTVMVALMVPEAVKMRALSRSGETTVGVITSVDPPNHNREFYRYTVNGVDYTKSTLALLEKGAKIKIYYLPTDPSVSTISEPASDYRETLLAMVVLSLLMGVGGFTLSVIAAGAAEDATKSRD